MKKLLIVAGAGASLDFGMPSVADISVLLRNKAKEFYPLTSNADNSLYTWVEKKLKSYISKNPKNQSNELLGFESLLFTIQQLRAVSINAVYNDFKDRLGPFIKTNRFPKINLFGGLPKLADSNDFYSMHGFIVDELLSDIRARCRLLQTNKSAELKLLQDLLSNLKTQFNLGFINLNYDNVILRALPDLETGFNAKGAFDRNIIYNGNWNFCYHMHGSVHFDMNARNKTELHEISWNKNLNSMFDSNSTGRNRNTSREGIDHLNSVIVTGFDKTTQLLREPFSSYFMQLDRLIYESDAILFMGYGFADSHLNHAFSFIRKDKTKKRKVAVIDWADDMQDGLEFRRDSWSDGLQETIPIIGNKKGRGYRSEPNIVRTFKSKQDFERALNRSTPVSIWYNGLTEACHHPAKILKELI